VPSADVSNRRETDVSNRRETDDSRRRAIVEAFLAASRSGDMAALLVLLDPDVVMRADETAARMGAVGESRGAEVVARFFAGRARNAVPAEIDGIVGVAVVVGGRTRATIAFTLRADRIISLDAVADPARIEGLDVVLLDS
jgi:RNA polymerase sigma-70 factor (ECF subfamily)